MSSSRPSTRRAAGGFALLPLLAAAAAPGGAQSAAPAGALFAHAGTGGQPVLVSGECYRSGSGGAAAAGVGYRARARGLLFAEAGAVASREIGFANGCITIGCPSPQVAANVSEERCGPRYTRRVEDVALALDARAGLDLPLWSARSRSRMRLGVGGGWLAHLGEPYAAATVAADIRLGGARWSLALDQWRYRLDATETRTRTTFSDRGTAVRGPEQTLRFRAAQRDTFLRVGAEVPVGGRR